MTFKETTHLSEILEESNIHPVIIFKYSNNCGSSDRLKKQIEDIKSNNSIYLVTVQNQPVLSRKIEDWFHIKHETPQIIALEKAKIAYCADHGKIKIEEFIK